MIYESLMRKRDDLHTTLDLGLEQLRCGQLAVPTVIQPVPSRGAKPCSVGHKGTYVFTEAFSTWESKKIRSKSISLMRYKFPIYPTH